VEVAVEVEKAKAGKREPVRVKGQA